MFYALAIVCDDFFVPSLEKICEVRGRDLGSLGEASEGTGGDRGHSARPRTAGEHSGGEDDQVKHLVSPHQTLRNPQIRVGGWRPLPDLAEEIGSQKAVGTIKPNLLVREHLP